MLIIGKQFKIVLFQLTKVGQKLKNKVFLLQFI